MADIMEKLDELQKRALHDADVRAIAACHKKRKSAAQRILQNMPGTGIRNL